MYTLFPLPKFDVRKELELMEAEVQDKRKLKTIWIEKSLTKKRPSKKHEYDDMIITELQNVNCFTRIKSLAQIFLGGMGGYFYTQFEYYARNTCQMTK